MGAIGLRVTLNSGETEMSIETITQLNRVINSYVSSGLLGSAAEKMGELATELRALRGSSDLATIRVAMDALADSAQACGYSGIPQAHAVYEAAVAVLVGAGTAALPHVKRHVGHSDPYVSTAFRRVLDSLGGG